MCIICPKSCVPPPVAQMIGSVIGIYNGKSFNQVEIRPEMLGHYLGELSITYKVCRQLTLPLLARIRDPPIC